MRAACDTSADKKMASRAAGLAIARVSGSDQVELEDKLCSHGNLTARAGIKVVIQKGTAVVNIGIGSSPVLAVENVGGIPLQL
jgi:hypothetical protein